MMPPILIRADSDATLGSGHVMRCLALARALKGLGVDSIFLSRALPGNALAACRTHGFKAHELLSAPGDTSGDLAETLRLISATGASALVVDHYSLDAKWETPVRGHLKALAVVDDLADRPHDCDLLVDQNLHRGQRDRYGNLVPPYCERLEGPRFAILAPEYAALRSSLSREYGPINEILVSYGGGDHRRETVKALKALSSIPESKRWIVNVVAGPAFNNLAEIRELARARPNYRLHEAPPSLGALFSSSDLALGAGGTTTWERCALGIPALVTIVAPNQAEVTLAAAEYGALICLGESAEVSEEGIRSGIAALQTQEARRSIGSKALALVDGQGANRVAHSILALVSRP